MGPAWAVYRAGYSLRRRVGWLERRLPISDWSDYRFEQISSSDSPQSLADETRASAERFFIPCCKAGSPQLTNLVSPEVSERAVEEVEALAQGSLRFFFGETLKIGWPPDWHRDPITASRWPKLHWSQLNDFGKSDVKWLWEPGRFGFAYDLVRAYRLTGDARHAETFWQLVESWRSDNPPNVGVHWMCGQECSIRVLAWCFALFGFIDAPATTSVRIAALVEMLAAHGDRIEGNIEFAVSQKNNHSINEALALWSIGTLFPILRSAERWEARGRELLEQEAARQIYDDGSYVQHSVNYHRFMLQSYCWALRLGELSNRPFSRALRQRVSCAANLLYQLTDETSGRAPNYGSNDGALLFHLDSCDFADYRPVLALAYWITERRRIYSAGPWDELLLWLCGEEALAGATDPPVRNDMAAGDGGYYTLRSGETWGFTRCCTYRARPAHADMLSVDLWWRGMNIVADPGTYSYNSAPPWNDGLRGTGSHNTVQVDGLDHMERGPRFTWFYWNDGKIVSRSGADECGSMKLIEAEHYGYERKLNIIHRRAILVANGKVWIVVDDLRGPGSHSLSSHWLFPKARVESRNHRGLLLSNPVGSFRVTLLAFLEDGVSSPMFEVVQGSELTTDGWFSDRYMLKERALTLVVADECRLPYRRATVISLDDQDPVLSSVSATKLDFEVGSESYSVCLSESSYSNDQPLVLSTDVKVASNG